HDGHGDLANDDALTRDAERALFLPNLVVANQPLERLDDHSRVHHLTIDDHLRRERREPKPHQAGPLPGLLDLAALDRARSAVDAEQVRAFPHTASPRGLLQSAACARGLTSDSALRIMVVAPTVAPSPI